MLKPPWVLVKVGRGHGTVPPGLEVGAGGGGGGSRFLWAMVLCFDERKDGVLWGGVESKEDR